MGERNLQITEACANCHFYKAGKPNYQGVSLVGECRRYPPLPIYRSQQVLQALVKLVKILVLAILGKTHNPEELDELMVEQVDDVEVIFPYVSRNCYCGEWLHFDADEDAN